MSISFFEKAALVFAASALARASTAARLIDDLLDRFDALDERPDSDLVSGCLSAILAVVVGVVGQACI